MGPRFGELSQGKGRTFQFSELLFYLPRYMLSINMFSRTYHGKIWIINNFSRSQ
jgi:hypothetical protein